MWRFTGNRFPKDKKIAGNPLFGRASDMLDEDGEGVKKLLGIIFKESLAEDTRNGFVYYWVSPTQVIISISDPEDAKYILKNPQIFSRKPLKIIEEVTGPNLFNAKYDTQAHTDRHQIYSDHIAAAQNRYWATIQRRAQYQLEKYIKLEKFDLQSFCAEYSLQVILTTVFGFKKSDEELKELIDKLMEPMDLIQTKLMNYRQVALWQLPKDVREKVFNEADADAKLLQPKIQSFMKKILRDELENPTPGTFLSDIKNKFNCTVDDLAGEFAGVLFAGKDSTEKTAMWVMLLLAHNPRVRKKLAKIIQNVSPQISKLETFEEQYKAIKNIKYLKYVINETLRLYPAFLFEVRGVEVMTKLGDRDLEPGHILYVNNFVIQRNPKLWGDDASEFRPERFEKLTPQQKSSQFSFGSGPQMCTAKFLAEATLTILVYELLSKNTPVLDTTLSDKELFEITLKKGTPYPKNPISIKLVKNDFDTNNNNNDVSATENEHGKEEVMEDSFSSEDDSVQEQPTSALTV